MGLSARLCSLLALVAIAPACDKVFNLDLPTLSTPCGVFDEPVPVPIDPRLVSPVRLTFNHVGAGGVGVVNARLDNTGVRRDLMVKWDGEKWTYDDTRMLGMDGLAAQHLRHMTATRYDENRMYGSLTLGSDGKYHPYSIIRSSVNMAPPIWVTEDAGKEVAKSTSEDSYPGGELVDLIGENGDLQRSVPIFRNASVDAAWTAAIAERQPGVDTTWNDAFSGGHSATENISDNQWATGGSLVRLKTGPSKNAEVLIYSARPRGNAVGADLYFSQRVSGRFVAGTAIETVSSDQEDVEPWVDEACTTIVFRRANPAGAPDNDDGDTITDGVIYQSTLIDDGT